jgi:hypothetical protein
MFGRRRKQRPVKNNRRIRFERFEERTLMAGVGDLLNVPTLGPVESSTVVEVTSTIGDPAAIVWVVNERNPTEDDDSQTSIDDDDWQRALDDGWLVPESHPDFDRSDDAGSLLR